MSGHNAPLDTARTKLADIDEKRESRDRFDPLERAARTPGSLKLAIRAMCYECQGRDEPGSSAEIARCDDFSCPLWQFRPHQGRVAPDYGKAARAAAMARAAQSKAARIRNAALNPSSRRRAINGMCSQCMGSDKLITQCQSVFPREKFNLPTPDGWRGCPLHPHRPRASK